ncbi:MULTISPECIES: ferric reductase-like transmembrane domain-containing protein [Actinosynnema]|uniref:ferric reductase-like transmembrane domain-containing protein n=1 Tax=Actinosynnema TaxID=40566 RepID=UPI0020A5C8B5|nr:ferric reductase-like transmembrane domain-containing protein [Actinosynnema pretiosum]MCP2092958.1 Ferric reductase like transmembrane component [Actinosynnema pretiosum]
MSEEALWFAGRATGLVSLVLLTAVVVLGVLGVRRVASARWPRFAVGDLRRDVSLLAVVFLLVHVGAAVAGERVDVPVAAALLPLASEHRPVAVGLGAVALDLLVAVLVTGALRTRLPHRVWRAAHWAGCALWPVALAHALLLADVDSGVLPVVLLAVLCLAAVALSVAWRVAVPKKAAV